jgi:hypothetical protein
VRRGIFSDDDKRDLRIDTLKSKIKSVGDLTFLSVSGEISESLAKDYADEGAIIPKPGNILPGSLFDEIVKNPRRAIFYESFAAHLEPAVFNEKVENVLPAHEIIYPVCFAVRIGDYQLADFLNIRLLQYSQAGGAFDLLAKTLASDPGNRLTEDEVKEHFVAQWPCPIETKDATHA